MISSIQTHTQNIKMQSANDINRFSLGKVHIVTELTSMCFNYSCHLSVREHAPYPCPPTHPSTWPQSFTGAENISTVPPYGRHTQLKRSLSEGCWISQTFFATMICQKVKKSLCFKTMGVSQAMTAAHLLSCRGFSVRVPTLSLWLKSL